jgi:hypothetical protein
LQYWDEKIETMKRDELEKFQLKKAELQLKQAVIHLLPKILKIGWIMKQDYSTLQE